MWFLCVDDFLHGLKTQTQHKNHERLNSSARSFNKLNVSTTLKCCLQPELNDLFFGITHQYHFYPLDVTDTCHAFGVWFIYFLFYFVVRFVLLWSSTSCLCLFPSFSVSCFLIIPVFFLHSLSARLFRLCSHFVPCGFWFWFSFLCLCFLASLRDFWTLDSSFLFCLLPACLCVFAFGSSAFCTS